LIPGTYKSDVPEAECARIIIKWIEVITNEAKDNLLRAKISQSAQANKHRSLIFLLKLGGRVQLSTLNHRHKYKKAGALQVAKFMPCYNGPYMIIGVDKKNSTVTLDLPNSPNVFPTFHTLVVVPYIENNKDLFPGCKFEKPAPVRMQDRTDEYYVRDIVKEQRRGHGFQYLIRWVSYGSEEDCWIAGSELKDMEALDVWLAKARGDPISPSSVASW
jgi:hypothetical protein